MKVISNYPIEFYIRRYPGKGHPYLQLVKAEALDFEKLICFDDKYRHVLIVIDEAPDIISHMASQSWRNRLVAAFTRQIRKNFNSLFLAAQDFEWIDKSMRWQVDVLIKCTDAFHKIKKKKANLERGEMLWLSWYDNSGQWTGESTEDRKRMHQRLWVDRGKLFPRFMWGDDEHEAVFDSWHQIDILDSLRKVDLRLSSIQVGDRGNKESFDNFTLIALKNIDALRGNGINEPIYNFYESLGDISEGEKRNLGKLLTKFNVKRGRDSSSGERWLNFANFDIEGMRAYLNERHYETA